MNEPFCPAALAFRDDGTLYSPRHDDTYHSAAGALAQARHVFLRSNGLPERWRGKARFSIIETGFGLGINFLATWFAWRDDTSRSDTLEFLSVEKYPFSADDLQRAHAAIIDDASIMPLADELVAAWPALAPGVYRLMFDSGAVALTLVFADIADALRQALALNVNADAIYLDGFAPAKNPEMWASANFALLARLSAPDATFATYTSSGDVKRALVQNGFEYRKVRGFGGKRAMLVGKRASTREESLCDALT